MVGQAVPRPAVPARVVVAKKVDLAEARVGMGKVVRRIDEVDRQAPRGIENSVGLAQTGDDRLRFDVFEDRGRIEDVDRALRQPGHRRVGRSVVANVGPFEKLPWIVCARFEHRQPLCQELRRYQLLPDL